MQSRRFSIAIIGTLLTFVTTATLFLSPAVRHTHQGGDGSHSHAVTHAVSKQHSHADKRLQRHGHVSAHDSSAHTHGSHSHTHAHPHSSHSHSSHSHSSHSHSSHSHTRDGGGNGASGEVTAAQSHVHIGFLWFEFTLPDFSGGSDEAVPADDASRESHLAADNASETIRFTSPFTVAQWVQLLLLSPAPLPERTTIPFGHVMRNLCPTAFVMAGRLPDAPPLPPPEFT